MGRGVKKSSKWIVLIVVVLVVIILIASFVHRGSVSSESGVLVVKYQGEQVAEYTLDELSKLKSETVYCEMTSGKGNPVENEYTGVMMADLAAELGLGTYETIVFTAADGYSSAGEVSEADTVMVAYACDGEALEAYDKGGVGPLRCVFTEDTFGSRSIMNVTSVDFQ